MAIDFPTSPSVNDTYTFDQKTWKWNGSGWALQAANSFNSNTSVGNSSFGNTFFVSYSGMSNPQSLNSGVMQTNALWNTVIVGPYTISAGNTLIITDGSRLVII